MTHRVNFTVKNVDETDPDFKLINEKSKNFKSFNDCLKFIREIKARPNMKEVLLGRPMIEEVA